MKTPSIRRALLVRCGCGIGLALCVLSVGIFFLVRQSLFRELDESLEDAAALLSNQIELENGGILHEWQEGLGTNRSLTEDTLFEFWDETTDAATRSPNLHWRDLPRFSGLNGKPLWRNLILPGGERGRAVGLRVYPFVLPEEVERMKERGQVIDPKSLPHVLVVARDIEPVLRTLDRLKWTLTGGTLLTLGLGFVLINRAVRSSLEPIGRLSREVSDRNESQLDQALDVPGEMPVELIDLAREFDRLLSRVAAIRQRERDFIRHAAHELRTPIAGLQAITDLALSQPRDAVSLVDSLKDCQQTAVRLGELVKRLSALSRVGRKTETVVVAPVDLRALIEECLERFHEPALRRGLALVNELPDVRLIASGDEALLRIVLNNLFDNAVSYSAGNGDIRLGGGVAGNRLRFEISNPVNEPPDDPERLFEPLFRSDGSRHDAADHLGIGLTLSRDAAQAMGGTLQARVEEAANHSLLVFTLELVVNES
ncbi:MAG TPA: ATP-binding protein [Luteolibacter sp.]